MDSTTLAQNFNDVSDQLQARGHRVIVRRLRGFLEAGDARGAELFLVRAKEALGNNDAGVGGHLRLKARPFGRRENIVQVGVNRLLLSVAVAAAPLEVEHGFTQ